MALLFSSHSFVVILFLFLSIINAQFNQATAVDGGGNPVWTSQPIVNPLVVSAVASVPPAAQPTLARNCQQMQSICTNAYNWMLREGFNGVVPKPFEVVYDLDSTRADRRRGRMCSTNEWYNHICPDTRLTVMNNLYGPLQPAVIDPFFYPNVGNNQALGDLWIIPGPNGGQSPSGLKYTSDEYAADVFS
jgi:hypothetical protein